MAERGGGPCPQAARSRGAPEGVFHVGCVRILWRCAARGRVRRRSAARGRVRSMLWAVDRGVGRVGGQHAPRSNLGVGISLGSRPRLLGS